MFSSNDYGKTFLDVTDLINNTFIRTEFGIAIGPENSGKVSLGNMQHEIDSADTESYDTDVSIVYQGYHDVLPNSITL